MGITVSMLGGKMPEGEEPWVPKTRQEWSEVFADGLDIHRSRREEAEAKSKAEKEEREKTSDNDGGNNGTPRKRTLGDILLGNT